MTTFGKTQAELQIIATVIGLCAGVLIVLGSVLLTWQLYFDNDPPFVSVKARLVDASGHERYVYHPGETIQTRRDFCVQRTVPVDVGRSLRSVDTATTISVSSANEMFVKGCGEQGHLLVLPDYTPPGRYQYSVIVHYRNNPLSEAVTELPPAYLEVVPTPVKASVKAKTRPKGK